MPFGYETAWFAVRADNPESVKAALGVRSVLPASWVAGLTHAVDEGIFVTPPVDGWVFAVGLDAFQAGDCERIRQLLVQLGEHCGTAFWFATHVRMDLHGWACADAQKLVRGYLYDGDEPRVVWDHGDATSTEMDLGFFVDDPRDSSEDSIKWWPTPACVLRLAARWTVDPIDIAGRGRPGVGLLGRL